MFAIDQPEDRPRNLQGIEPEIVSDVPQKYAELR
jgi:hypothetical protein